MSSTYLGSVAHFALLQAHPQIRVEAWEHYHRQSYRNRCRIAGADGIQELNIPVEKAEGKIYTRDVKIAGSNWQKIHWGALQAAYSSSPFFEYYQDELAVFYNHRYTFLWDWNEDLQHWMCQQLSIELRTQATTTYLANDAHDYRFLVNKKTDCPEGFRVTPYYQVFSAKNGFLPNLSAIDLLCNMGPESPLILVHAYEKH